MADIALRLPDAFDPPSAWSKAPPVEKADRNRLSDPLGESFSDRVDPLGSCKPSHLAGPADGEETCPPLLPLTEAGEPAQQNRRGKLAARGTFLSFCVHLTVIACLVWQMPSQDMGSGGAELDAVSVDVIDAAALESVEAQQVTASAGAAQPMESTIGEANPVEQSEVVATRTAEPPREKPADMLPPPEPPSDAMAELLPAAREEPQPRDMPKEETKPQDRPAPYAVIDMVRQEEQAALSAGGAASRAQEESSESEGAAGASSGQADRYAMRVRLALGKAHPRHTGTHGRVQVSFRLTEGGDVQFADVLRSSGDERLDQSVLMAVRATRFPAPPPGMTERQRTYIVPFDFR